MKFDLSVPPSLLEMQQWFAKVVGKPVRETGDYRLPLYDEALSESIEKRISPGPRLSAGQRIGIYNQQYWFRLFVLLQDSYPTLLRLFGHQDFNRLIAEPYFQKYFPCHWSLSFLGSCLPQWIEEEYKEEDKSLILEAARLDEVHERLFFIRAAPVIQGEDFRQKIIYLQSFVALFDLHADFFSFREALLEQEPSYWQENDFPLLDASRKRIFVIYRVEKELRREEISLPQKILLKAFEQGAFLNEALSLLGCEMESDANQWIQTWMERGWLGERRSPREK